MFLAGFGVGAAVAIWFAPKSGADLRGEFAGKVAEKVADGQRVVMDAGHFLRDFPGEFTAKISAGFGRKPDGNGRANSKSRQEH